MEVLKNFLKGNPVAAEARTFEEWREEPGACQASEGANIDGLQRKESGDLAVAEYLTSSIEAVA